MSVRRARVSFRIFRKIINKCYLQLCTMKKLILNQHNALNPFNNPFLNCFSSGYSGYGNYKNMSTLSVSTDELRARGLEMEVAIKREEDGAGGPAGEEREGERSGAGGAPVDDMLHEQSSHSSYYSPEGDRGEDTVIIRKKIAVGSKSPQSPPNNKRVRSESVPDFTPPAAKKVARKSTAKSAVEEFRKIRTNSALESRDTVQCSHCDKMFTNQDALIKHLIENLPASRHETRDVREQVTNEHELNTHSEVPRDDDVDDKFDKHSEVQKNDDDRDVEDVKVKGEDVRGASDANKNDGFESVEQIQKYLEQLDNEKSNEEESTSVGDNVESNVCNDKTSSGDVVNHNVSGMEAESELEEGVRSPAESRAAPADSAQGAGRGGTGRGQTDDIGEVNTLYKIKCTVCKKIFPNFREAWKHRRAVHPGLGKARIWKKMVTKKIIEVDHETEQLISQLVQTSLFQCKDCSLCYVTAELAAAHRCSKDSHFICHRCRRKVAVKDKKVHMNQHGKGIKFTMCPIVENLLDRVVYECPQCDVCFETHLFKSHFKECGELPTARCDKCSDVVLQSRMTLHLHFHDSYIKIQFKSKKVVSESVSAQPASQPWVGVEPRPGKLTVYHCQHCNTCMHSPDEYHINKHCLHLKNSGGICMKCGLSFSGKSLAIHKAHHGNGKFTLRDMDVYSLEDRARIPPPMPKYYRCSTCKMNIENMYTFHWHLSYSCQWPDYVTCEYCLEDFTKDLYRVHRMFHHDVLFETDEPEVVNDNGTENVPTAEPKVSNTDPDSSHNNSDEEIETNSANVSTNRVRKVVYKCLECDVILMSVTGTYSHKCTPDREKRFCDICKQYYNYKLGSFHKGLHDDPTFVLDNLSIVTFRPDDKEANKHTAGRKERSSAATEPGQPKVYKCNDCSLILFRKSSTLGHRCVEDKYKRFCVICGQYFACQQTAAHKLIHDKFPNFVAGKFNMILFDSEQALHDSDIEDSESDASLSSTEMKQEEEEIKTYTIYKCSCGLHQLTRSALEEHRGECGSVSRDAGACSKCARVFSTQALGAHAVLHHARRARIEVEGPAAARPPDGSEEPRSSPTARVPRPAPTAREPLSSPTAKCTANDPRITKMKENTSTMYSIINGLINEMVLLFKCVECEVFFTSQSSCAKHVRGHARLSARDFAQCKLCRLQFVTKSLYSHMKTHHADDSPLQGALVEEYTPTAGDGDESPRVRLTALRMSVE